MFLSQAVTIYRKRSIYASGVIRAGTVAVALNINIFERILAGFTRSKNRATNRLLISFIFWATAIIGLA